VTDADATDPRSMLGRAWAPVLAWFDTADVRCPCKAIVAPLVADWRASSESGDLDPARQLRALQAAIGAIQRYSVTRDEMDDDPQWAPLKSAIGAMRESAACTPGDPHCRPMDPPMGAAPSTLADVLSPFAKLGGEVVAPAVAPIAQAAAPAAAPVAQAAGQAAGKSAGDAANRAIGEAAETTTRVVVVGAVVVVVGLGALALALSRRGRKG
jgi:hypothetical protein